MVKETTYVRPTFLKNPIGGPRKTEVRRNVGSFLDDWKSKKKQYRAPLDMLPDFFWFLGKKIPEFKSLKRVDIATSDSTTSSIYHILRRAIEDRVKK